MRAIQVELPDKLAQELDTMVADGWFSSEADIVTVSHRQVRVGHHEVPGGARTRLTRRCA